MTACFFFFFFYVLIDGLILEMSRPARLAVSASAQISLTSLIWFHALCNN